MIFINTDPTLFTLTVVLLASIFVLFLDDKKILYFKKDKFNSKYNLDDKSYFFVIFLILFFLVIGYQGQYLNFETIDSDVHTYLLVGNDVLNGFLPYENEWDDKGPFLYFFYAILIFISNKNLIIFKILCDLLVLFIAFTISKISFLINKENKRAQALFSPILFVLLLSPPWGSVEYSEIFALVFLSLSLYILIKNSTNKIFILISGIIFGISTLINQGSGVFFILFALLLNQSKILSGFKFFISGISFPHLITLGLYASKDLLDVYFVTLLSIPIKYSSQDFNLIYEFNVYLRETFYFDPFIYSMIVLLIVISIFKIKEIKYFTVYDFIPYIGILLSLLFFYLGSTGYKHHLIFLLFFLSLLPLGFLKTKKSFGWVFVLLFSLSFGFIGVNSVSKAYSNIYNLEEVYSHYPLKQLSTEIKEEFNEEYSIFAIDHTLVLFYLNKENESYIIHPTNYLEPAIFNELTRIGKVVENELSFQIEQKPNIILCSQEIRWLLEEVNCEVTDFFKGYKKINTEIYFDNLNRTFYKDPYRTVDLYINNEGK